MNTKKNLNAIAEAGVNIIAKLKRKSKDVIIPQSFTYREDEQSEAQENAVYKVKKPIPYEYVPPVQTAESSPASEDVQNAEPASATTEKEAHFSIDDISAKLENIKSSLIGVLAENESKRNELLSSGLKKEDLQKELDKTAAELEGKLNGIRDMMDKTGDIIAAFDTATQHSYSALSEDIKTVSENAEKTDLKIESIAGTLNEAKQKVGEIHQTTASIDKLYDSVFELKTANIENKNAIDAFNTAARKRFRIIMLLAGIFGATAIAGVVLSIITLLSVG